MESKYVQSYRAFKDAATAGDLTKVKMIYQASSSDLTPVAIEDGFFGALKNSKFKVADYIIDTILANNPEAKEQIRINLDEEITGYLLTGKCDSLYYLISHHLTDYATVNNKIASFSGIPPKSEKGKNIGRCSLYLEMSRDRDKARSQMRSSNRRSYPRY